VTLVNLGPDLTNWVLTWSTPPAQKLDGFYGGVISQTGRQMKVTAESWNPVLTKGEAIGFGYSVDDQGARETPVFTLNGKVCARV
jgi:endoglucanase